MGIIGGYPAGGTRMAVLVTEDRTQCAQSEDQCRVLSVLGAAQDDVVVSTEVF